MKALKIILVGLGSLIALLLVISFFLPSKWSASRSIAIQAAPPRIFPYLNNLKRWPEWTAWTKEVDPAMETTYEGPDEGVGALQEWRGEKMGNGTLKITESMPHKAIVYELEMEGGQYKMNGKIELQPSDSGTTVMWTAYGDVGGSPIGKYFSLMMDSFVGPDFEKGLAKLKATVESKQM